MTTERDALTKVRDWLADSQMETWPYMENGPFYEDRAEMLVMLNAALAGRDAAPPREAIAEAVNRFLAWPLPKDFGPDCGISFDGRKPDEWNPNKGWPVGTNLFTADQARAMLEHCLATPPAAQSVHVCDSNIICRQCDLDTIAAQVERSTDGPARMQPDTSTTSGLVDASAGVPSTPSADAPTREGLSPDASPAELWAEIYRLRAEVKGPDGYATWKDAAIAERLRAGYAARGDEARVPREPTGAMMAAGMRAFRWDMPDVRATWLAMYDAAIAAMTKREEE